MKIPLQNASSQTTAHSYDKGYDPCGFHRRLKKWKDSMLYRFTPTIGSLKQYSNRSFCHSQDNLLLSYTNFTLSILFCKGFNFILFSESFFSESFMQIFIVPSVNDLFPHNFC